MAKIQMKTPLVENGRRRNDKNHMEDEPGYSFFTPLHRLKKLKYYDFQGLKTEAKSK